MDLLVALTPGWPIKNEGRYVPDAGLGEIFGTVWKTSDVF